MGGRGSEEGGGACAAACVYAWRVEIERLSKFEDVAQLCNLPLWHAAASWPRTPPSPLYPTNDLPQHLCDTNFAQENKVIHRELWGEWHFMSTLCTYWSSDRLSDKQTASQPALLWHGLLCSGKLGTVLIMQICRANWFGRQAQLCQQSRKQNAAYAQFQQKATANVCKYNAHTPRKQHTHNRNLSPTRTLGENWKGISRAAEKEELEEGK